MGYVSFRGGEQAIREAERLSRESRLPENSPFLEVTQVEEQLGAAVDQVMGEGGLYDRQLAALAVKQAEGDLMEAAFLVRAYRTTLPRICYSIPSHTREMFVLRRISSAFREVPGGQILGASRDFSLRLLDFKLMAEKGAPPIQNGRDRGEREEEQEPMTTVLDLLEAEGAVRRTGRRGQDQEPDDITTQGLRFPASRSARLQALARGETGAMTALAYASLRGYGSVHPTLAELRVGYLPLKVRHPVTGETVTVGEVMVTECHAVCAGPVGAEVSQGEGDSMPRFSLGFGLVFGRNERKAISMAVLDRVLEEAKGRSSWENEEFILYHLDGVDSMGFVEHLKLPHYVTFLSAMDRWRSLMRKEVPGDVRS